MSGKSRNHRSTLRTFREMAVTGRHVKPFRPRARWRGVVRAVQQREGWNFSDAFLFTLYSGVGFARVQRAFETSPIMRRLSTG